MGETKKQTRPKSRQRRLLPASTQARNELKKNVQSAHVRLSEVERETEAPLTDFEWSIAGISLVRNDNKQSDCEKSGMTMRT